MRNCKEKQRFDVVKKRRNYSKQHNQRLSRSCRPRRQAAPPLSLDERIALLLKHHEDLIETVKQAMASCQACLETVHGQVNEATKLKAEIEAANARRVELSSLNRRGVV